MNDRAQQYSETGQEKLSSSSPLAKEHQEITSLDDALLKIKNLEERLKDIEYRIPKKYPEVKFLTYKDRKRILVSYHLSESCICAVSILFSMGNREVNGNEVYKTMVMER